MECPAHTPDADSAALTCNTPTIAMAAQRRKLFRRPIAILRPSGHPQKGTPAIRIIFSRLIVRACEAFLKVRLTPRRYLRRPELDGQLVELAGEAERRLVVLVVHARAGIHADIEGLVDRHEGRDGVRDLLAIHFLAVHRQDAGAALGHAGAVVFEVKHDGVFARRERFLAFPAESLHRQEVVGEHRLALQQVEAVAAEAAAERVEHALGAALREFPPRR